MDDNGYSSKPVAACSTCTFSEKDGEILLCKRFPRTQPFYQPIVDPVDWCGEYKYGASFKTWR